MISDLRQQLIEALDRLVTNKPIYLDKGAALTAANVIRETGRTIDQVKLSRFPTVQARIKEEKALLLARRHLDKEACKRTKRSLRKSLFDAQAQRDHLACIVEAQNEYLLELLDRLERLEKMNRHY